MVGGVYLFAWYRRKNLGSFSDHVSDIPITILLCILDHPIFPGQQNCQYLAGRRTVSRYPACINHGFEQLTFLPAPNPIASVRDDGEPNTLRFHSSLPSVI